MNLQERLEGIDDACLTIAQRLYDFLHRVVFINAGPGAVAYRLYWTLTAFGWLLAILHAVFTVHQQLEAAIGKVVILQLSGTAFLGYYLRHIVISVYAGDAWYEFVARRHQRFLIATLLVFETLVPIFHLPGTVGMPLILLGYLIGVYVAHADPAPPRHRVA